MRVPHLLLMLVLFLPIASRVAAREWTSSDGKYRIEAELVGFDTQRVRLKKGDGKVVVVPLDRLSPADRQYVAELQRQEEAAEKALEGKGIQVTSGGLQIPEEADLRRGLRDLPKLKKSMLDANRRLEEVSKRINAIKTTIGKLTQANLRFNAELATVGPTEVTRNNRLVGAIRANEAQIVLLLGQAEKLAKQQKSVRGELNRARESFVEEVLRLRKMVDQISTKHAELTRDSEITAAMARLKAVTGEEQKLGESRTFTSSVRQLERLEEQVLSESIPLRTDGGALYASVVIDGKHTHEMVVDSGASIISLPARIARQCGIEPSNTDPTIELELADGRKIPGRLVTVSSMRVGQFTVNDVQCAVLGPEG